MLRRCKQTADIVYRDGKKHQKEKLRSSARVKYQAEHEQHAVSRAAKLPGNHKITREQTRKKIGVAPDRFMVLFPSNDHERKGAKLILDAIEGLDERLVLVVAGKAPLNHPAVLNLGFCPDMPSVYAAADVTVLASIYEPFGMVGPESVLCGTPVLLADTIGAVEVLTEPACFSFAREAEVLRSLLLKMMKRFESGELELVSPERYIHYAYSFDAYLDELIGLLAS